MQFIQVGTGVITDFWTEDTHFVLGQLHFAVAAVGAEGPWTIILVEGIQPAGGGASGPPVIFTQRAKMMILMTP